MVVVWDVSHAIRGGEVSIIAKAHTDVDIQRMRVAEFDDSRYCLNFNYLQFNLLFLFFPITPSLTLRIEGYKLPFVLPPFICP